MKARTAGYCQDGHDCFGRLQRGMLQPFSQKSRTPTVAKEFQIGHYDPTEADLEHFWNCCSAGFLGERLYICQGKLLDVRWETNLPRSTSVRACSLSKRLVSPTLTQLEL